MKRMEERGDSEAGAGPPAAGSRASSTPASATAQGDPAGSNAPSAAPGQSLSARIVAKVVDPAVRDDGRTDPQFSPASQGERPPSPAARGSGSHHPVRDRLLAKARNALVANAAGGAPSLASKVLPAAPAPSPPVDDWNAPDAPVDGDVDEAPELEPLPELADDLDLIGAPERPRPERTPSHKPSMPAPTALMFGTLCGLVGIAALFAVLIELTPHDSLRGAAPVEVAVSDDLDDGEELDHGGDAPAISEGEPPLGVQRPPRAPLPPPWRLSDGARDGHLTQLQGSMGMRSFLGATQAAGLNLKEAYRVLTAFKGLKNLDRCRPKDTFTALVDPSSGRLSAFEYTVNEEEVYQAREGSDGRLVGKKLDLAVQRHRVQGVVILDGNFEDAARRSGFEPGLGEVVDKALSGYVSTAQLEAGDVLGVVAQEVTVLGSFARYAGVEALEYRPVRGEPLRIYYHEADKSRGYVDSKGRVFGKSRWTRPVPGASVTSRYNPKRMHPILRRIKPHNGTDFGAPIGTAVVAAAAGKVTFVGRAGPNGNMITVAHGGGVATGYSHLSRFVKGLKVGDVVDQRQLIGYVGSTGRSTGPHLHFSAKKNGRFIDPETLNLDGLSRLAQDQRLPNDLRRRYDRMLDALHLPEARARGAELAARAALAKHTAEASGARLEVEIASARAAPAPAAAPSSAATESSAAAPVAATPSREAPNATAAEPPMAVAAPPPAKSPVSAAEAPILSPLPPVTVSLEPEPATTMQLAPEQALPQSPGPDGTSPP
jgi:murein DD-endopeptidase MepM/ murein hydrolase activator NlpD